jgi:hypothetical protein
MQRFIQKILLVCCLLAGTKPAAAFSLLGVFEAWQVPAIGHNALAGDIGGVKNIGEEYRINIPVITYGFDDTFMNYFGSEGVAAIDAAFAILNSLPPFSSLDRNLTEFPLFDPATGVSTTFRDSRRINLRAAANNLIDLKSTALSVVLEQLGLTTPERWVWTLRDRRTEAQPPRTNYLVIMRNFDPTTASPSAYVNGTRYTYQVVEDFPFIGQSDAVEIPVDPEHQYSAVAGVDSLTPSLPYGGFYTYLTRDDIGGLRYIYSPENINWEPFPAGTQTFAPDRSNLILLTNLDLTLFSLRSRTFSPAEMSNFYPGLIITAATPRATNIITNSPVLVTNFVPIQFFTNLQNPLIVSNIDLTSFSSFVRTNPPAAVLAAFPDLVITSTNAYPTQQVAILSIVLTNAPKQPWDDPFTIRQVLATNYFTNLVFNYQYTFRNVITNYSSQFNRVRREITGLEKEPWSDALNPIYRTNVQDFIISEPSGGVIIVPTNLIGYVFAPFPPAINVIGTTNIMFQTNVVDLNTGLIRLVQEVHVRYFTNAQYAVYPIEIVPPGGIAEVVVTNGFTTNFVVVYDMQVGNVITNYFGPTTPITRFTYEISPDPFNPAIIRTNLVIRNEVLPVPSGGFLIDTNLTGFEFLPGFATTNIILVTNVVFDITNPVTGVRTYEEFVYPFTNVIYSAFAFVLQPAPAAARRPGVDKITFVKLGNGTLQGNNFNFTNRYQVAFYDTNGFLIRQGFQIVQNRPDILFVAGDLGVTANAPFPVGITRSANFSNQAALNTLGDPAIQGGPGVNFPPINISFSKIGPFMLNSYPGFIREASPLNNILSGFTTAGTFLWGSFDGSTNAPIIFPKDITIEQIEARTAGRLSQ